MYKTSILIISERKELAVKYKKLLENLNQNAAYTSSLSEAISIIQKQETEFIIISDTIKEKLSSFIEKIRILTYNFRPIIIAISKSGDIKDRLSVLESGADDCLGEEISKSEFLARFRAHLRRYIESFLNPITHLSDKIISIKALKQSMLQKEEYSYILVKIKSALEYRRIHGEIAFEKAIKTLGAIINSTLSKEDFIGHLCDDEMLLITKSYMCEQIASFLTFAFDNILNKFYSKDEFLDNFTIQSDDNMRENKTGLMRLNIAACQKPIACVDYREILNNLYELISSLDESQSSAYIIDRVRLGGEVAQKKKNKVLIFEFDTALSYLIKSVCELNNIEAKIALDNKNFKTLYKTFCPDVVILDWGNNNTSPNLDIAKKISKDNIKLIFSSSYLNKKEILKSGADLYLPKPYDIEDMLNWIKKFLHS